MGRQSIDQHARAAREQLLQLAAADLHPKLHATIRRPVPVEDRHALLQEVHRATVRERDAQRALAHVALHEGKHLRGELFQALARERGDRHRVGDAFHPLLEPAIDAVHRDPRLGQAIRLVEEKEPRLVGGADLVEHVLHRLVLHERAAVGDVEHDEDHVARDGVLERGAEACHQVVR